VCEDRHQLNHGRLYTIPQLMQDMRLRNRVSSGVGGRVPIFMGTGRRVNGIFSANEYLTRGETLMRAYEHPHTDTPNRMGRKVAVIGRGAQPAHGRLPRLDSNGRRGVLLACTVDTKKESRRAQRKSTTQKRGREVQTG